jgi:hypothetical protein
VPWQRQGQLSEQIDVKPAAGVMPEAIEYRRERVRVGKVPISTKLYQGIGALPGTHKDFAFNTFLLLYYSQILGIPAFQASIVLAISLVVDAITG